MLNLVGRKEQLGFERLNTNETSKCRVATELHHALSSIPCQKLRVTSIDVEKASHILTVNLFSPFPFTPHLLISKDKGKAVPLQAWSGPEGSRKLRFPDYMTTA
jgi:hypothetical protein